MATYGSDDLVVEFDDSGGTLRNMTQYVETVNGFTVEAIIEMIHTFGDTWQEHVGVGVSRVPAVTLGGLFDDTASTGPNVIFNAPGNSTTRTLKFTWGGTKTSSVECIIQSYSRRPERDRMTRYEVMLQPTGAVTEA